MQHGDFVEIEYVGRVKLTNEIFDLTSEEMAKKEKIFNPKAPYGPALVVVGSNMTIRGVMKELEKMDLNEERNFEVLPSDAFGPRDPKLIRIIPFAKFIENKINPVPGTFFEIEGMQAKVQSISGGRVRVDFNNPLAGKTLSYAVKILRKIEGDKEKIESLLKYYQVEHVHVMVREKEAEIKTKKPASPLVRKFVTDMVTKWIKGIEKVEFKAEEEPKQAEKHKHDDETHDSAETAVPIQEAPSEASA
jgi:peptidylprolyl isomerase/FKBP-type peptidyl-prolyl cis-trans isomerase SlyD